MSTLFNRTTPHKVDGDSSFLSHPLSRSWCVVGWAIATIIFTEGTQLLGGLTSGDAADSTNTTWAISHGFFSCAYPPGNQYGLPFSAPLYPWVSGALAALFRIGHRVAFPDAAEFGPHCATAVSSMYEWSLHTGALETTLRIGYLGWFAVMAGVVSLLRSSGRGRRGWEPLTLILLAAVPPVFLCLHEYFHPQDLLAMGLILGAIACVRRQSWVWAGILLGLAFTSQQFALLALAPLLVLAPTEKLIKFVSATVASIVVVVAPLALFEPRAAIDAALAGSGTTWASATLLDTTRLSGPWLFFASRFLPVVGAMLLAWWARDRLGASVLEPIPLLSILATSLSLRLLFEVNLWGYYFLAVAVLVLVIDVFRGRLRWSYLAWLVLIIVAFHPVIGANSDLTTPSTPWVPLWAWQVVLATSGMLLCISPLITSVSYRESVHAPGDNEK
jgi:hypothetical protein